MGKGRASATVLAAVGVVAAACAVLALVVATARPGDPAIYPAPAGARTETVFVVVDGIHADLVAPREALRREGGVVARAVGSLGPGDWVAIGWGDERYYKQTGISLARALDGFRCLFWPANTRTVVRMAPLSTLPQAFGRARWARLTLSEPGFRRLARRLERAFLAPAGVPELTPPATRDPTGRYFRSSERFGIVHLCGHWTADLLDAAGVPTTPAVATFAAGLILDLGRRAAPAAVGPPSSVTNSSLTFHRKVKGFGAAAS